MPLSKLALLVADPHTGLNHEEHQGYEAGTEEGGRRAEENYLNHEERQGYEADRASEPGLLVVQAACERTTA